MYQGGVIQFKVPQNIDMEDKIVGPLTLIQFLYLIGGGILIYVLLTFFGFGFIFWLLAIPIAIIALSLAFLKIQDQPLSHFVKAGLIYWNRPKIRIWQRQGEAAPVLKTAPKSKNKPVIVTKKAVEKSELEKLAQSLDTRSTQPQEVGTLGKMSHAFERALSKPIGKQNKL